MVHHNTLLLPQYREYWIVLFLCCCRFGLIELAVWYKKPEICFPRNNPVLVFIILLGSMLFYCCLIPSFLCLCLFHRCSSASGMFKIVRPAVGESVREMPLAELKNKYRKLLSLDKARSGWEDEYEVSSKQCMHGPNCRLGNFCTVGRRRQEVNVLGGLILPVWGTIEKALSKQARQSHKRFRVVRIETTTDNRRIVGLLVPNAAVESVLQDLAWVQDIDDQGV
uniref:SBNO alpha/beta domain-containing protein n=1 Tax=Populus davidiana TaxID=266767 RepID=A0A6M2EN15_9ROSI